MMACGNEVVHSQGKAEQQEAFGQSRHLLSSLVKGSWEILGNPVGMYYVALLLFMAEITDIPAEPVPQNPP